MFEEQFRQIFGQQPYSFQTKVAEHLLHGHNVILQAPTGSGKTKAALFPYLLSRNIGVEFPQKMLYCMPMRVLARSFYNDLKQDGRHSDLDARLQTGEQQDDRRLEGQIIFATIDQILSSFLNIPYALSLRQGNVNAGAVACSYLVLDEFHLLDPDSTLPTTLEVLRVLKGMVPFVLMTATFSGEMLGRLAALLNAKVVTVSPPELQVIPSQRGKDRRMYRRDALLTAEAILSHHRNRSIAICNTVERAQTLCLELTKAIESRGDAGTRVILLHSRFLRSHRQDKEDQVRRSFGKNADKAGSIILVATQVIEVGLDITCDVMHTEVAPASAILQRAGRCARFESERGDVYVYQVPPNRNGEPNYAPYLGEQATLCTKTWRALTSFQGQHLDFGAEQRLVDLVHTEADSRMLDGLGQTRYFHRKEMEKAIGQQDLGLARRLIRNDDSVTLLVHPNPTDIESPYGLEGFSLFFGSLHGQAREWRDAGLPNSVVDWVLKYPQEVEVAEEEDRPSRYEWCSVNSERNLSRSAVFVVNPLLVEYDCLTGFRFGRGDGFRSPPESRDSREGGKVQSGGYALESYHEHIQRMLDVYQTSLSGESAYAAARFEQQMGLPKGELPRSIRLAICLHDLGKMDRRWQDWAHEWQRRIGMPVSADYLVAHTHYEPDNPFHQTIEKKMPRSRPPHATEGAVAAVKMLHELLGKPTRQDDPRLRLIKAIFTAIARHHSPKADSYREFSLVAAAQSEVERVLAEAHEDPVASSLVEDNKMPRPITGVLVMPSDRDELIAYFLIVRALRLADQRAVTRKE